MTRQLRYGSSAIVVFLTILSGLYLSTSPVSAQPTTISPIGNPIWKPVDFHLFTGPASSDEEFFQTNSTLLPLPKHEPHGDLVVGPGTSHAGPYQTELAAGLVAQGYPERSVFSVEEFSGKPNGVYFVWMNLPNPGTIGSSPDFASGSIIPNSLFPMSVPIEIWRNGEMVDSGEFDAKALDANLNPPFSVEGHSHFPYFLEEDATYLPGIPLRGNYEFRVRMIDQQGNGWQISAPFEVVPEPATFGLFVIAIFCIGGGTRIRPCGTTKFP